MGDREVKIRFAPTIDTASDLSEDMAFNVNPVHLEPAMDINISQLSSPNPVSPIRAGRTIGEVAKEIDDLRKENFNLKLRIFFMEGKMAEMCGQEPVKNFKVNIELQIELKNARKELERAQEDLSVKDRMLDQALKSSQESLSELRKKSSELASLKQRVHTLNKELQSKEELFVSPIESENENTMYKVAFGMAGSAPEMVSPSQSIPVTKTKEDSREVTNLKDELIAIKNKLEEANKYIKELESENSELQLKSKKKSLSIKSLIQKFEEQSQLQSKEMWNLMEEGMHAVNTQDQAAVVSTVNKIKVYFAELLSMPLEQVFPTTLQPRSLENTFKVREKSLKRHSEVPYRSLSDPISGVQISSDIDRLARLQHVLDEKSSAFETLQLDYNALKKEYDAMCNSRGLADVAKEATKQINTTKLTPSPKSLKTDEISDKDERKKSAEVPRRSLSHPRAGVQTLGDDDTIARLKHLLDEKSSAFETLQIDHNDLKKEYDAMCRRLLSADVSKEVVDQVLPTKLTQSTKGLKMHGISEEDERKKSAEVPCQPLSQSSTSVPTSGDIDTITRLKLLLDEKISAFETLQINYNDLKKEYDATCCRLLLADVSKEVINQVLSTKLTLATKGLKMHEISDKDDRKKSAEVPYQPPLSQASASIQTSSDINTSARLKVLLDEKSSAFETLQMEFNDLKKEYDAMCHRLLSADVSKEVVDQVLPTKLTQSTKGLKMYGISDEDERKKSTEIDRGLSQTSLNGSMTEIGQSNNVNYLKEEILILKLKLEDKEKEMTSLANEIEDLREQLQVARDQKDVFSQQAFILQQHLEKLVEFLEQFVQGESFSSSVDSSAEMLNQVTTYLNSTLRISQSMSQNLSLWDFNKDFSFDNSMLPEREPSFALDNRSLPLSDLKPTSEDHDTEGRTAYSETYVQNLCKAGNRRRWSLSLQLKQQTDELQINRDHSGVFRSNDSEELRESTESQVKGSDLIENQHFEGRSHHIAEIPVISRPKPRPCWNLPDRKDAFNSLRVFDQAGGDNLAEIRPFREAGRRYDTYMSSESDIWSEPDREISIQRIGIEVQGPLSSPAQKCRGREKSTKDGTTTSAKNSGENHLRCKRSGSQNRMNVQLIDKRLSVVESQQNKIVTLQQSLEQLIGSLLSQLSDEKFLGKSENVEKISDEICNLKSTLKDSMMELQGLKETLKDSKSQEMGLIQEMKGLMGKVLKAAKSDEHLKGVSPDQAKDIAKQALSELNTFKEQLLSVTSSLIPKESTDLLNLKHKSSEELAANVTHLELLIEQEKSRNSVLMQQLANMSHDNKALQHQLNKLQYVLNPPQSLTEKEVKDYTSHVINEIVNYQQIGGDNIDNFDTLLEELNQTKERLKVMESKCIAYELDIAQVSKEKGDVLMENQTLKDIADAQKLKLDESGRQLKKLQLSCKQLTHALNESQNKIAALEVKCKTLNNDLSSLSAEKKTLSKENVTVLQKNKSMSAAMQSQLDKLADMNRKHTEYNKEKNALQSKIRHLEMEVKGLQRKVEESDKVADVDDPENLHFKFSELELELSNLRKKIPVKDELIHERDEMINDLMKKIQVLEDQYIMSVGVSESLEQENSNYLEQLSSSAVKPHSTKPRSIKIDELNTKVQHLSSELNDKNRMIEEQKTLIEGLQRDLKALASRDLASKDLYKSIEQKVLLAEHNARLSHFDNLEKQLRQLNAQLLDLKGKLESKDCVIQEQINEISKLKDEISAYKSEYDAAKPLDIENAITRSFGDLQTQLTKKQAVIVEKNAQSMTLKKELESKDLMNQEQTKEIKKFKGEISALKCKCDVAEFVNQTLENVKSNLSEHKSISMEDIMQSFNKQQTQSTEKQAVVMQNAQTLSLKKELESKDLVIQEQVKEIKKFKDEISALKCRCDVSKFVDETLENVKSNLKKHQFISTADVIIQSFSELQTELTEKRATLMQNAQTMTSKKELESKDMVIEEKINEIKKLKAEISALQSKCDVAKSLSEALEKEKAKLKEHQSISTEDIMQSFSELQTQLTEKQSILMENAQTQSSVEELMSKDLVIQDQINEIQKLKDKISILKCSCDVSKFVNETLENVNSNLKEYESTSMEDIVQSFNELQTQSTEKQAIIMQNAQTRSLKKELKSKGFVIQQQINEIKKLKNKMSALKCRCNVAEFVNKSLDKVSSSLKEHQYTLKGDIMQSFSSLQAEPTEKEAVIKQTAQILSLKKELESKSSVIHGQVKEIMKFKDAICTLKCKCDVVQFVNEMLDNVKLNVQVHQSTSTDIIVQSFSELQTHLTEKQAVIMKNAQTTTSKEELESKDQVIQQQINEIEKLKNTIYSLKCRCEVAKFVNITFEKVKSNVKDQSISIEDVSMHSFSELQTKSTERLQAQSSKKELESQDSVIHKKITEIKKFKDEISVLKCRCGVAQFVNETLENAKSNLKEHLFTSLGDIIKQSFNELQTQLTEKQAIIMKNAQTMTSKKELESKDLMIQKQSNEIKKFKDEISILKCRCDVAKFVNETLENVKSNLKEHRSTLRDDIKRSFSDLQTQLTEKRATIMKNTEILALKKELESKNSMIQKQITEIKKFKDEISVLKCRCCVADFVNETLENVKSNLKERQSTLTKNILMRPSSELPTQPTDKQAIITRNAQTLSLKKELESKDYIIQEQINEIKKFKEEISALRCRCDVAKFVDETLENVKSNLKEHQSTLSADIMQSFSELQAQLTKKQEIILERENQCLSLKKENRDLLEQLEKLKDRSEKLQKRLEVTDSLLNDKEGKMQKVLQEKENICLTLKAENGELKEWIHELESRTADYLDQQSDTMREEAKTHITHLKPELSQKSLVISQKSAYDGELQSSQTTWMDKQNELASKEGIITDLKQQNQSLKENILQLQKQHEEQVNKLHETLQNLNAKVKQVEEDRKRSKDFETEDVPPTKIVSGLQQEIINLRSPGVSKEIGSYSKEKNKEKREVLESSKFKTSLTPTLQRQLIAAEIENEVEVFKNEVFTLIESSDNDNYLKQHEQLRGLEIENVSLKQYVADLEVQLNDSKNELSAFTEFSNDEKNNLESENLSLKNNVSALKKKIEEYLVLLNVERRRSSSLTAHLAHFQDKKEVKSTVKQINDLVSLTSENERQQKKILELNEKSETLQAQIVKYNSIIQEHRREKEQLLSKLDAKTQSAADLQIKLHEAENKLSSLHKSVGEDSSRQQKKFKSLEVDNDLLKESVSDLSVQLDTSKNELSTFMESSTNEKINLERDNLLLKDNVSDLEQQREKYLSLLNAERRRSSSLTAHLTNLQDGKEVSSTIKQINDLVSLTSENEAQQKKILELNAKLEMLQAQISEYDSIIQEQKREKEHLLSSLDMKTQWSIDIEEKIHRAESELASSRKSFDENLKLSNKLETKISNQNGTIKALEASKYNLENEAQLSMMENQNKVESLESKVKELQTQVTEIDAEKLENSKVIDNLKADLSSKNLMIKELEVLKTEKTEIQQQCNTQEAEIKELQLQVDSLNKELTNLRSCKISTREQSVQVVSEQPDFVLMNVPAQSDKLCQTLSDELPKYKEEVRSLRKKVKSKEEHINQLQTSNSNLNVKLVDLENQLQNIQVSSTLSKMMASVNLFDISASKISMGQQTPDMSNQISYPIRKTLSSVITIHKYEDLLKDVRFQELIVALSQFVNVSPESVSACIAQLCQSSGVSQSLSSIGFEVPTARTSDESKRDTVESLKDDKLALIKELEEYKQYKLSLENQVQELLLSSKALEGKSSELYNAAFAIGKQRDPRTVTELDKNEMAIIKHLHERKWSLQQSILRMQKELCKMHPSNLEKQVSFIERVVNIYNKIQHFSASKPQSDSAIYGLVSSGSYAAKERYLSLQMDVECLHNTKLLLKYFVIPFVRSIRSYDSTIANKISSLSENINRKLDVESFDSIEFARNVSFKETEPSAEHLKQLDSERRIGKQMLDLTNELSSVRSENAFLRHEIERYKKMPMPSLELQSEFERIKQSSEELKKIFIDHGLAIIDANGKDSSRDAKDTFSFTRSESVASLSTISSVKHSGETQPRKEYVPVDHHVSEDWVGDHKGRTLVADELADEQVQRSHYSSPDLGIESDPNQEHVTLESRTLPDFRKPRQMPNLPYGDKNQWGSEFINIPYAFIILEDFELLKKEVEESIVALKSIESRVHNGLKFMTKDGTPKKSFECSTLKGILDCCNNAGVCLFRSQSIMSKFKLSLLPSNQEGKLESEFFFHQIQKLENALAKVTAEKEEQDRMLIVAMDRLKKYEKRKELFDKAVTKRLVRTKNVLRQVKGNILHEEIASS